MCVELWGGFMHSQVCWRLDAPGRSDEGHEGTSIALTHARVGCRSEVVINSDGQMLCLSYQHISLLSLLHWRRRSSHVQIAKMVGCKFYTTCKDSRSKQPLWPQTASWMSNNFINSLLAFLYVQNAQACYLPFVPLIHIKMNILKHSTLIKSNVILIISRLLVVLSGWFVLSRLVLRQSVCQ